VIIDNKGKLFGKVSIIDILIVFVFIGIIAGVGYKFTRSKTPTVFTKQDTLRVEYFVEEALDATANSIKVGDRAKEAVQNASFGTVTDLKIDKSVSYAATDDGEIKLTNKPGYSSVVITMEAKGIYGSFGTTIDNTEYYIGSYITLRVGNAAFYGRITRIEKIG
jgi:hypothetical protein